MNADFFLRYSLFEASYDSIVFDCMITVVSPRLTLLEVVVTVRVTLHAVSITERPIARAIKRPLPGLPIKREGVITPLLFIVFIVLFIVFIVLTNCNHSPPSPSGFPREGSGVGLVVFYPSISAAQMCQRYW